MIGVTLLFLVVGWLLPLQPFEPYTGHCWATELPGGATDRHCFAVVFDGKHVRDTHAVKKDGVSIYAGETLYSVDHGRVIFTYWNSLGGLGRGTAEPVREGLRFSLMMQATPDAAPQRFDTVWHKIPTGYEATTGGETRYFRRDD